MAATLRNEFSRLLHPSAYQCISVRWKKPPKWRDPTDVSWAAPLLEMQKQKAQRSDAAEQPPAMLHMVSRVRDLRGRPYWEKRTMQCLGLHKVQKYEPVVHKNTPHVNRQLACVKHLVKIVPITFPDGLPSEEADFYNSVLHSDGRLQIKKTLKPLEKCLTESEEENKKTWHMDKETVEKATRKVLEQFSLSREYFPAKYVYKYNQDGKEYRYTGNHNILGDRDWY